uniref:Putative secreted protein n=1 Tax=Anopheles marajoara TaxID=58244 RepID=A0A2M4CB77_9DIPT
MSFSMCIFFMCTVSRFLKGNFLPHASQQNWRSWCLFCMCSFMFWCTSEHSLQRYFSGFSCISMCCSRLNLVRSFTSHTGHLT